MTHRTSALLLAAALAAPATAQTIDWAEFDRNDTLLSAQGFVGLSDDEEKDYAWADLDQDGWIDLICVRKQPFTSTGRRRNVLFMNEGGVLVDRTDLYATSTDIPGDEGFLTPTNDRDVAIGDLNNDGWLDFVTATTFSPGQPKEISHPRIYMNLGNDGNGNWLGFHHEEARIPDWGTYPNMCGVAIGDVTGDGFADIYFSHYEQEALVDLNDRLLINDGTANFTDESSQRMTSAMRGSSFGTSAVMDDMNMDGTLDVVSVSGSGATGGLTRSSVAYNDPNNEGFFSLLQEPYNGAPYHVATGDLNQDGLPDMILSDDGDDRYLLNEGNDPFGRVDWSAAYTFNTDDGFGSNNYIIDVDRDGLPEAIIADVDVDIPGCDRRLHIFHNRGGQAGGFVDLHEERSGSNYGAEGLPQLEGTHDIAIFDLDNDGDNDLVVGLCTGTRVYENLDDELGSRYCTAIVNTSGAAAVITPVGSPVAADNDLVLTVTDMPVDVFGFFLTSQTQGFVPNPAGSTGNLCVAGTIGRFVGPGEIMSSGPNGTMSLTVDLTAIPAGAVTASVQPGETHNFTAWFRDQILGTQTSNFSDAIAITFQ